MKEKKGLLLSALALAVLLAGATVLYNRLSAGQEQENLATQSGQAAASSRQGETVPDFVVLDADGNEVSMEEMRGKPVILNFWASWCAPCKSEMPAFEDAYQEYGDQIHFMMVNLTDGSRETVDTALGYIREQGYTFPVYCDTTLEAGIAYGASAIPITFFIDEDGYGVAYAQSALSRETLQTGVDMLLEK